MEIEKITENGFNLHKEGDYYVLAMGAITRETPRETTLKITEIDTATASIVAKCGCTKTSEQIVDATTMLIGVEYKECDRSFSKIVEIGDKTQKTKLKIQGVCNT
jgi:hypothetical protein